MYYLRHFFFVGWEWKPYLSRYTSLSLSLRSASLPETLPASHIYSSFFPEHVCEVTGVYVMENTHACTLGRRGSRHHDTESIHTQPRVQLFKPSSSAHGKQKSPNGFVWHDPTTFGERLLFSSPKHLQYCIFLRTLITISQWGLITIWPASVLSFWKLVDVISVCLVISHLSVAPWRAARQRKEQHKTLHLPNTATLSPKKTVVTFHEPLLSNPLIPIQLRVCSFLPRLDLHWWLCATTVLFLSVCLFMFPSPISHFSL